MKKVALTFALGLFIIIAEPIAALPMPDNEIFISLDLPENEKWYEVSVGQSLGIQAIVSLCFPKNYEGWILTSCEPFSIPGEIIVSFDPSILSGKNIAGYQLWYFNTNVLPGNAILIFERAMNGKIEKKIIQIRIKPLSKSC